jgi:hypothetical protein
MKSSNSKRHPPSEGEGRRQRFNMWTHSKRSEELEIHGILARQDHLRKDSFEGGGSNLEVTEIDPRLDKTFTHDVGCIWLPAFFKVWACTSAQAVLGATYRLVS